MAPQQQRIVVLGSGFAGLYAAMHLERALARQPWVEILVVNRENFFLFTPMLHEVASADLDLTHIVNPIRKMLRRSTFFCGDVAGIDLERRVVELVHGDEAHPHEVGFDQLVLALGSVTNFYGLPGLAEHALTMKSLGDAIFLRNRIIRNLEQADFECCAALRERLLTFVVAGGGFAGTETVGSINDFIRGSLVHYPHLREEMIRVVLVHSGEGILPELPASLGAYARKQLERAGVEVRVSTRVKGFDGGAVELGDGTVVPTCTLVWTAGTSPHPMLEALPVGKERGRIVVEPTLAVPGAPGVWALGDCAVVPDPDTGKPQPPTAQHALREGKVVARNVVAALRGKPARPFRFQTVGQLASIGHHAGVARVFGVNFSGFFAWWLWRTIYLSKLPRFEKKVRVALDWTLDLVFSKDLVQYLTARSEGLLGAERLEPHEHDPAALAASASAAARAA